MRSIFAPSLLLVSLSAYEMRVSVCVSFFPPKPNRMENAIELYADGMSLHVLLWVRLLPAVCRAKFTFVLRIRTRCVCGCAHVSKAAHNISTTRQYITHNLSMQTCMTRRLRTQERESESASTLCRHRRYTHSECGRQYTVGAFD